MIQKKPKQPEVSVLIPMKNSKTTIVQTLLSIGSQQYPIKEIIVVDNASTDTSVELVKHYQKSSPIPTRLFIQPKNKGVGASYNLGAHKARSKYLVLMHSDGTLPSRKELTKLMEPYSRKSTVATYSTANLPKHIWDEYNFWEKCHFSRVVDKEDPGFTGKFDSVKKEVFEKIGGFDDSNFGEDIGIGGEDADLFLRLKKYGEIVLSSARVIHLHYIGTDYHIKHWFYNRKLLAMTYGRILRKQGWSLPIAAHGFGLSIPLGFLLFLVKPALAIIPFFPGFHVVGILLLFVYAFVNSKTMYITKSTRSDPRILLLPFIDIFLLYYEAYWTLQSFLFIREPKSGTMSGHLHP